MSTNGNTALQVSPVNDIIKALNEGEVAKARVPELERENAELRHQLSESQRHAQALELKCGEMHNTIDSLNTKVRSLVVERDDAGFREMETQDKLDRLVATVRSCADDLDAAVASVKPTSKPEVANPAPMPPTATSASSPISVTDMGTASYDSLKPESGQGPNEPIDYWGGTFSTRHEPTTTQS